MQVRYCVLSLRFVSVAQKGQDRFPLYLAAALQLSVCLCVNVDSSRIAWLISSYLDILTLNRDRYRATGEDSRATHCFSSMSGAKTGFGSGFTRQSEKWCRKRASQVACRRLPTLGMTHYAAQTQSNFSSLTCEKRTLQSFSSQRLRAKTFSKYDPSFCRPEGSTQCRRQGGIFEI